MDILCRCPNCQQRLSIASRKAGQTVRCPACKEPFSVPLTSPELPVYEGEDFASGPSAETESTAGSDSDLGAPAPPPELFATEPVVAPTELEHFPQEVDSTDQTSDAGDDEDEGFALRPMESELEDMDLTPMVDVTFLLLIFFMITASFSPQKSLKVPPPDPDEQGATQSVMTLDDLETTSVIVQIDERNAIYVDYEPLTDPDQLADTLKDKLVSDRKAELVIEAHEDSVHDTVVKVIDAAYEAGMQKIRLATRRGPSG